MTSTTRTIRFLARATAIAVALPIVSAAPLADRAAHAYDCNVHASRTINSQTTSFRDHCENASPSAGDWPICVCDNTQAISSNPSSSTCPAGHTEVGRCVRSGDYYQSCDSCSSAGVCLSGTCEGGCGPIGAYCPAVFHNFVPSADACGAAAHDVVSAVEGCRTLCESVLVGRYFDQTDGSQSSHGSWRLGASGSIPDLGSFVLGSGKTGVDDCIDRCAPPNAADPSPPFGADGDNHWRYVSFARWNANTSLDGWLRSYTVNKDKPDAPRGTCQDLVDAYCNDASVTSAPNASAKRVQCKKNLLLRLSAMSGYTGAVDLITDLDFDLSANTSPNPSDDGFCDLFFRGNYLADGTCYHPGDGQVAPQHRCSTDGGVLSGGPCNDLTATCDGGSVGAFPTVFVAAPNKSGTCGTPTVVTGGSVLVSAAHSAPLDVVSATWRNETNGASGALVPTLYGWLSSTANRQSFVNVPLQTGTINRITVTFVDSQLRVSGDAVAVDAQ